MALFGMDGGARIGSFIALGVLGVAVLILGGMAIGAASEGAWERALITTGLGEVAAAAALAGQAYWSRRGSNVLRGIYAGAAGGPPAMLGLVALLAAAAHLNVGEWGAALFGLAVGLGGGLAALGALVNFRRTRTRILPPFNPLRASIFEAHPDPPAYPRPREIHLAPRKQSGLLSRIRRALWLQRD